MNNNIEEEITAAVEQGEQENQPPKRGAPTCGIDKKRLEHLLSGGFTITCIASQGME